MYILRYQIEAYTLLSIRDGYSLQQNEKKRREKWFNVLHSLYRGKRYKKISNTVILVHSYLCIHIARHTYRDCIILDEHKY